MPTVIQPAAVSRVLEIFAGGSQHDRLALTRLAPDVRSFFSDALESTGRTLGVGSEAVRAQATLATLTRFIWSLVPSRLLGGDSPDFRRLAEEVLLQRIGEFAGSDIVSRNLAVIFKRIRRYARTGRTATSLDLDQIRHQGILVRQSGRCNHCLYEFGPDLYRYAGEEDGISVTEYRPIQGEIALSQTYRKPELDHIIPLVFGGDQEENWQILCATCNRGKSDQVSYFFNVNSLNSNRLADLYSLTSGKRYATIAEARGVTPPEISAGDGRFYRIHKRDFSGLLNIENLVARYG